MNTSHKNAFDCLLDRGFVAQCTNETLLRDKLEGEKITFYIGFDGTADSLHVGHLVALMAMRTLSKDGHIPIALVGGATSLVGDPSFRNTARPVLSESDVARNIDGITLNIRTVIDRSDLVVVNNAEWLRPVSLIDFMRNVGTHFTVARMLSMETVKSRLEANEPMTALEFTYMMLQANDFQELARRHGCVLQMGGSDQWGNIVNGIELARKADGTQLFGLTTPLLQNADGSKMGKTAKGAVWLSAQKTSPFEFWQFWRNVDDRDVERFLLLFTELPKTEIKALLATGDASSINRAKRSLANEVTAIVHGREMSEQCDKQAEALFGYTGEAITTKLPLIDGTGLLQTLKRLGWAESIGMARRSVTGGAVRIGGQKVTDPGVHLDPVVEHLLQMGKRKKALVTFV